MNPPALSLSLSLWVYCTPSLPPFRALPRHNGPANLAEGKMEQNSDQARLDLWIISPYTASLSPKIRRRRPIWKPLDADFAGEWWMDRLLNSSQGGRGPGL